MLVLLYASGINNQALDYAAKNPGTAVHFKGPFTHNISDILRIYSKEFLKESQV